MRQLISSKTKSALVNKITVTSDEEEARLIDEGIIIPDLTIVRVRTESANYAVIGTGEDPLDECPELFSGSVS